MRLRPFLLPVLLGMALKSLPAAAQSSIVNSDIDIQTGARLEVRSVFDPPPPSGYAPLKITISGGNAGDHVWRLGFESKTQDYPKSNSVTSQAAIPVPGASKRTASFLLPLAVHYGHAGYGSNTQIQVTLSSPFNRTFSHWYEPVFGFPAVAISSDLADGNTKDLEEALKKKRSGSSGHGPDGKFGSEFDPADAPEDWRGYSGFDYVMLGAEDWRRLSPGAQHALLQWVRLGGALHLYVKGQPAADLPAAQRHRSLGQVLHLSLADSGKLPGSETVERYWDGKKHLKQLQETAAFDPKWQLIQDIGKRASGSWQVVLFLLAFGLLVGPVNLFVLAPSGRRHRLFYTTPLISLGASVLMFGVILLQDGTGGSGSRFALVDLQPEEATAYVIQKQVSRTGMLLGTGFELKQPAVVEPLALPDSPWVKLTKNSYSSRPLSLVEDGLARGGSYFQSRTEQAQMIRAAIPSRARLEVTPGEVPQAVSALGFTVEDLFYADAEGKVWKHAGTLATGQKADLKEVPLLELQNWWREKIKAGALTGDGRVWDSQPRSQFFASAREAPGFVQETLDSIRWQHQHLLVHGSTAP